MPLEIWQKYKYNPLNTLNTQKKLLYNYYLNGDKHMRKIFLAIFIIVGAILAGDQSWAVEFIEKGKNLIPDKTDEEISIDGELKEAVWQGPPINKIFKTLMPIYGEVLNRETLIWAAYNTKNLYFAFKCLEPVHGKVKTTLSQRDKILRDDYVGVMLDSMGSRQSSFEFYVNPSGIQMDAMNSAVSGGDITPDFVWYSAAKMTPDGYQAEIRIPLETIRYKSGAEVKMGVAFLRAVPHLGVMAVWPEIPAGQTDFNVMANLTYKGLKGGLKLEILPNVTYSIDSERITTDTWNKNRDTNIGVGIKYGLTSSITAEATWRPDFSQVESDAFQVTVNRRYPIFYSEKRPFFMENKDVLDFTVISDGMMITPVHTRFIVDPGWAAKLSGSAGKMNFVLLAADDRSAGWDKLNGSNISKSAYFGVLRAKYNIGSDNTLGILYTGRHFAGQRNDVAGMDLKYRLSKEIRASLSYLHSLSRESQAEPLKNGTGLNAMLEYYTPRLISIAVYERYSNDFFMATAFQNRVGISRGGVTLGPVFTFKSTKMNWLKRFIPSISYFKLYDLGTKMGDTSRKLGISFAFAPQGELYIQYWHEDESWAGKRLDKKYLYTVGSIQLFKWLHLYQEIIIGEQIYYHPTNPFIGNCINISFNILLEPSDKLKVGLDYLYSNLKEKQTGNEIYKVDIYNIQTVYQFNKYFFLRGIIRYDNFEKKLLTDILASFTFIPGTVVHLGYGSLYLKDQWRISQNNLLKMRQGLFFKASYLWRFK